MSNIHVLFRSVLVKVLHKRRGDAFADPLADSGDQQTREEHPVGWSECAEQDSAPRQKHAGSHRNTFADLPRDRSAEKQGDHDRHTAHQVQSPARGHAAFVEREIQVGSHCDNHNRDGERTQRVCRERRVRGDIIASEIQFSERHDNSFFCKTEQIKYSEKQKIQADFSFCSCFFKKSIV